MKTNFRFLALSAAILSMFTACQREELEQNQKPEGLTHTVTFLAGAPQTKTSVEIEGTTANFSWTADDAEHFKLYENNVPATKTEATLGEDGKMTIKATFNGEALAEGVSYIAVVNNSNDSQIMYKEAYEESADILVSKAVNSLDPQGVQLQFRREVAIAKMTLKGLDAGEVVNHVTVSSTADIAGSYDVQGWNSTKTSLDIYSAKAQDDKETYSIVANEYGEAVVWFTCIPQDAATLTVKVEAADGDTYTKKFSKEITLTQGDVNGFGVAMKKNPWVAVDLADIDETMPVVITMATTEKTYALSLTGSDGNALGTTEAPKAIEVSVEKGELSEKPNSDILWNIANNQGNLTIYPDGIKDEWLYTTTSNNGVRLGAKTETGFTWQIDDSFGYLMANDGSDDRYLGVYQGNEWRTYKLSSGNIQDNIKDQTLCFYSNSITEDPTAPKLSVSPTSKTWESEEVDATVFTVTTNTEGQKDWSVSPETLDWATIAVDKATGTITVTPNGANTTKTAHEATLTVTHAAGDSIFDKIILKQNGTGAVPAEETIEIKYTDIPSGYASSGTSGTFIKSTSQKANITIGYAGLNTKSSKGNAYEYTMFIENQGYMYSNTALDGYYVKSVTATFSSGTGIKGKAGITLSSTVSSSRNSSVSGSVSKSGTITTSNEDTKLKYWNLSTTGANVQIVSVKVVYALIN